MRGEVGRSLGIQVLEKWKKGSLLEGLLDRSPSTVSASDPQLTLAGKG